MILFPLNRSMSKVKQLLIKNTIAQTIGQVLNLLLGLVTTVVLSRYLGVEWFGYYNYIFAFTFFFLAFNDLGIQNVATREISARPQQKAEILGAMLTLKMGVAALCLFISWGITSILPMEPILRRGIQIYALIFPLIAIQSVSALFFAIPDLRIPIVSGVISKSCSVLFMLIGVSIHAPFSFFISILIVAEMINASFLWYHVNRMNIGPFRWPKAEWKILLRSGAVVGGTGILNAMINRLDFIMIEHIRGASELGFYAAAYRVTNLLEVLPVMMMATLFPVMSQNRKDPVLLRRIYSKSVGLLSLLGIPLGIFVSWTAPWIIRTLYGNSFGDSAQALSILIWQTVCIYIALTGGQLLMSIGKEKINFIVTLAAAILNLTLNLIWIPRFGYVGAAWATVASSVVTASATLAAVVYYLKLNKAAVIENRD